MLHVTYEAVDKPDRIAVVDEERGKVRIAVDKTAPLDVVVRELNTEFERFLAAADWFQLWHTGEIVSRGTPDSPLGVVFIIDPLQPVGTEIQERRGLVSILIHPGLTTEEFVAAMNPAVDKFLARGCWFQHYAGEIIDMSPEPMSKV